MNNLIKAIFNALPAASFSDLTEKINENRKNPVSISMVSNAVAILRKQSSLDPNYYGWTIPHTKRGLNPDFGNNRLFPVLVNRDGDFFVGSDHREDNIADGNKASLQAHTQQIINQCGMLKLSLEYNIPASKKRYVKSIITDMMHIHQTINDLLSIEAEETAEIIKIWKGEAA